MLTLRPGIHAEVVTGMLPPEHIWLAQHWLEINPPMDDASYSEQFMMNAGSQDADDGYETISFDKDTLTLCTGLFHLPEKNLKVDNAATQWLDTPIQQGLLRLKHPYHWKDKGATVRWIDPEGKVLICLREEQMFPDADRFRLRITEDVYLLFAQQQWRGWMLEHPAVYLADDIRASLNNPPSPVLNSLLAEYYNLVAEPFSRFDALEEEQDPAAIEQVRALYKRLGFVADVFDRQAVICDWIEGFSEGYFFSLMSDEVPLSGISTNEPAIADGLYTRMGRPINS